MNVFGDEERHVALPLSTDDSRFCLFSVRFSSDGSEIVGGSNDGYIYLFDRGAQVQSLRLRGHDDDVNAVSFVDSTTHVVASGGDDGYVKVWDRRALRESDPRPMGILAGHVDGITYIDPKGDGRHLISNSKDQSVKLWDIRRFSGQGAVRATEQAVRNQNWDYRWQSVPPHLAHSGRSAGAGCGRIKRRGGGGGHSSGGPASRAQSDADSSIMTYRGHSVLQTLIRCHFSPAHTTGQRYIYTGCATGAVISKLDCSVIGIACCMSFPFSIRLSDWRSGSSTSWSQILRARRLLASFPAGNTQLIRKSTNCFMYMQ